MIPIIKPKDKNTARSLIAIGRAIQRELNRASKNADSHHLLGKEDEVNEDLQRFALIGKLADAVYDIAEEQGYNMDDLLGIKECNDVIFIR